MSVNLDGVFLGVKHGIRGIKKGKRGGSIINLSSIEGLVSDPNIAAYNVGVPSLENQKLSGACSQYETISVALLSVVSAWSRMVI